MIIYLACALGLLHPTGSASAGDSESKIAYIAATDGLWQVWLIDEDGKHNRQVTKSETDKAKVSWFPNGRTLLVDTFDGRLFRVDIETGQETQIPLSMEGVVDAVVSPDGTSIAFSVTTAQARDDNEIWTLDLEKMKPRRLTNMPWLQHEPVWDPEADWIYFLSGDGGHEHDIWRVSTLDGSKEQITAGQFYNFDVSVGPGGRLAFSSNRTGDYEIWMRSASGAEERLTQSDALDGGPSWSPDGRKLIFHSTRSGALQLWRLNVDRTNAEPVQLTRHESGARGAAWWHPRERSR